MNDFLNVFMETVGVEYSEDWKSAMDLVERVCKTMGLVEVSSGRIVRRACQFKLRKLMGGQYVANFKISGSKDSGYDCVEYGSPPSDSGCMAICKAAFQAISAPEEGSAQVYPYVHESLRSNLENSDCHGVL